jgi:hypothetical protein
MKLVSHLDTFLIRFTSLSTFGTRSFQIESVAHIVFVLQGTVGRKAEGCVIDADAH